MSFNNNEKTTMDDKQDEDVPIFTDVKLMTGPNMMGRTPIQPCGLLLPKALGLKKPSPLAKRQRSSDNIQPTANVASDSNKDAVSFESLSWSVQRIPEYYALQRSTLKIRDVTVETIVQRLSAFSKRRSEITFVCQADNGRIECTTASSLKFALQLWEAEDEEDVFLLEVQRLRGCSIEMKNIRVELFHVASTGNTSCPTTLPASSRTCKFLNKKFQHNEQLRMIPRFTPSV